MKVNRTLQVSLDQADVEKAILAYIESQGIDLSVDGMHASVSFTAGRQPNGLRASVDMVEDEQTKQGKTKRVPSIVKSDSEVFAKKDSEVESTGSKGSSESKGEATDAVVDTGTDSEPEFESDDGGAVASESDTDGGAASEETTKIAPEPKNSTSLFGKGQT